MTGAPSVSNMPLPFTAAWQYTWHSLPAAYLLVRNENFKQSVLRLDFA